MGNIIVVAYLVSCSQGLLECKPLDTGEYRWKAPAECNADLPRLKRQFISAGYRNVMGRCEWLIKDNFKDNSARRIPLG